MSPATFASSEIGRLRATVVVAAIGSPAVGAVILHAVGLATLGPLHFRVEGAKVVCVVACLLATWRLVARWFAVVVCVGAAVAVAPVVTNVPLALHPLVLLLGSRVPLMILLYWYRGLSKAALAALLVASSALSVFFDGLIEGTNSLDGGAGWHFSIASLGLSAASVIGSGWLLWFRCDRVE